MRRYRVLISSAGRRVELMRCFRADAARLGMRLELMASDMNPTWSAACQESDACYRVPSCHAPDFLDRLLDICARHEVDLLVPTIDPEVELLSRSAATFRAQGTDIAISSPAVVALARDKLQTAQFLRAQGIPVPRTLLPDEVVAASNWSWPAIVKPRSGSSSAGVQTIDSPAAFKAALPLAGYIAQELLEGQEYTVNLFFDPTGALRCAVPHLRYEVRAGEVSKGMTCRLEQLDAISRRLGQALSGARGALCFQAMVDSRDRAAVFEINARFGGGFPLAHRAGARFTQWLLEEMAGLPPSYSNAWRDRIKMLRYDAAVFVDHSDPVRSR